MNISVLYYSKTGFTKRYVEWLSDKINCNLISLDNLKTEQLNKCDILIFASWFHAGKIQKLEWFKAQNFTAKTKIILATGASPSDSPDINQAIRNNFVSDYDKYKIFYLPSGLCYEKMSFGDKCIMKVFGAMMKAKKDKTKYEQEMANMLGKSFDHSKKEYLESVISYIQGLEK